MINLVLGVHNHQPYGNFDHIIEHACERCYLPFLQVLERHPRIKFSLHFTGYLLSWISDRYPEIIHVINRLVECRQVEMVTGGFYEPILATIPDADKMGQIKKLTDYLHLLFDHSTKPLAVEGMWLAERVWEPHLPAVLVQSGIKYVALDDSHFASVGMPNGELFRAYVTEEAGKTLEIFPINQKLRYMIPFDKPSAIIDYLRSQADESGLKGAFYFDDGEKFGIWPGTYESVYSQNWLEELFTLIEKNEDWIKVSTFGEYRRTIAPAGRIYLPTASYMEMMEWALPSDQSGLLSEAHKSIDKRYSSFLRGGFWRNFMVKYPEVNNLHKKMLKASQCLTRLEQKSKASAEEMNLVRDKLWMSQSNDPYWHGVFGGLYLTNLRTANYQALVEAEAKLDEIEHKDGPSTWIETEINDFDCDGKNEVIVKTPAANYYLAPSYGGALVEFDYKLRPFNLIDTLARRPEPYHSKLRQACKGSETNQAKTIHEQVSAKESNLDQYLAYDWHRRLCFQDHILAHDTTAYGISRSHYGEIGDFTIEPYTVVEIDCSEEKAKVNLMRSGHVWLNHRRLPLTIEKSYKFVAHNPTVKVSYTLINNSQETMKIWFAPELNFNFLAADASDRYFINLETKQKDGLLSSQKEDKNVAGIGIVDHWLGFKLIASWSAPGNLWRYPVYTVSNSESGFERVYQGSALLPNWQIVLETREPFQVEIDLTLSSLPS